MKIFTLRHGIDKRQLLYPILLFACTFITSGYFSFFGVDRLHDGMMLKNAVDVSSGLMLFRDSFTPYNAITTLIQAGSLLIFGKYLITIKLLTAFVYGCISILLYLIYKKILPLSIVFVSILLWIFMAPYFVWILLPWSSVYSLLFQLLALYMLILFIETNNIRYLFFAGVAAACTFWTRHSVGMCLFAGFFLYFVYQYTFSHVSLKTTIQRIIYFMVGCVCVTIPFIVWLWVNKALYDWWIQSFVYAYYWGKLNGNSYSFSKILFSSLLPFSFDNKYINSTFIWILLPLTCIVLIFVNTIVKIRKASLPFSKIFIPIAFIALSSWGQYYPIMDYRHCYWAATPMVGILAYVVYHSILKIFPAKKVVALWISILILIFLFLPDIIFRLKAGYHRIQTADSIIDSPLILKGMWLPKDEMLFYYDVAKTIDKFLITYPSGNVVSVVNSDAIYYTFNTHIYNIHPVYLWWMVNFVYLEYHNLLVNHIKQVKPLIITSTAFLPRGYCEVKGIHTINDTIIAIPCDGD